MKKGLVVILAVVVLVSTAFAIGKWMFKEAPIVGWAVATDAGDAGVNLLGYKNPYSVTVDPDGKIWTAAYYSRYYYDTNGTTKIYPDTIATHPLFVMNTDGEFDTLEFLQMPDATVDTLHAGGRGLVTDHEGNIIYANNNQIIYKINYQTYEVMDSYEFDFSPARPAVDANGYVYFTGLFGGDLVVLEPDNWTAGPYNTIAGITPSVCRGIEVSLDGNDIYVAAYNGGLQHFHSDFGVDGLYAIADTVFKEHNGTLIEVNLVQRDPNGLLWVGTREEAALNLMWALDPANNYAIVDSTSFEWWANTDKSDTTTGGYPQPNYLRAPRDAAFSSDGNTLYIADFYSYTIKAFELIETAVEDEKIVEVPDEFGLFQNYPNPFNPTTSIKFTIAKEGLTTLKVYDMLGRVVATLVNEQLSMGVHTVDFDASRLASGTYIYEMISGDHKLTKKMTLTK
jgi:sugar lactone lactonase YvrE